MAPIQVLTLSVTYRLLQDFFLWRQPGPIWRGALGRALKELLCKTPHSECSRYCNQKAKCVYALLFEEQPPRLDRKSTPSPPFVLHTQWFPKRQFYQAGECVGFSFTLFDGDEFDLKESTLEYPEQKCRFSLSGPQSVFHIASLLSALIALGFKGLGRGRALLELVSVDVLDPDGNVLSRVLQGENLLHWPVPSPYPPPWLLGDSKPLNLNLHFLTPTQLKHKGHFVTEGGKMSLERLMGFVDRRWKTLGGDNLTLTREPNRPRGTFPIESNTFWVHHTCFGRKPTSLSEKPDLETLDFRQFAKALESQSKNVSGLMGCLTYRDVPPSFANILRIGTLTHIGRQSAKGLGAYALEVSGQVWTPPYWREFPEP